MVRLNPAYIHGERIWESFINKLGTKDLTFTLILTIVFTFPLNSSRLQEYSFSSHCHLLLSLHGFFYSLCVFD